MKPLIRLFWAIFLALLLPSLLLAQWLRTQGPSPMPVGKLAVAAPNLFAANIDGMIGALFKSSDRGMNWSYTGGGNGKVGVLAARDSLVLFTTLGAPEAGPGFAISTNAGAKWAGIGTSPFPRLGVMALVLTDSSIFASFTDTAHAIFRSTDRGATWTEMSTGLHGYYTVALATSGSVLYAGTSGGGVYRSINGGALWEPVNTGLGPTDSSRFITMFAVRGTSVFAGTASRGIFRSTDSGATWMPVNSGLANQGLSSLQATDLALFAGTKCSGVFRSTDDGGSWHAVNAGLGDTSINCLAALGPDLYAGTATGGLFRSTDAGENWEPANTGLPTPQAYSLAVFGSGILAANYGLYSSNDQGVRWKRITPGTGATRVAVADGKIYAAQYTVSVSADSGRTWTQIDNGLLTSSILCLGISGSNLFVGANGDAIFRSTDGGLNWQRADSGLTSLYVNAFTFYEGTVLAAANGTVFRSTNNGESWAPADSGLVPAYYYSFARIGTTLYTGSQVGVSRSTDGGRHWSSMSTGLVDWLGYPVPSVNALAVADSTLFAGTWGDGIFVMPKGGTTWTPANTGSSPTWFNDLAVLGSDLYAATGTGVWRRPLSEMIMGVNEQRGVLPEEFSLAQNYPNPFNPSTTIRYSLPRRSHVMLTVFNTLGQKVTELVNGEISAGSHEAQFNASNLASGVYFYRLQAGAFVQTRSLVVLR